MQVVARSLRMPIGGVIIIQQGREVVSTVFSVIPAQAEIFHLLKLYFIFFSNYFRLPEIRDDLYSWEKYSIAMTWANSPIIIIVESGS